MIVRATVVVTMDGAPITEGAVQVDSGRIVRVGKTAEIAPDNERGVELRGCVVLPGLINAHCHLDYTCLRGKIVPRNSFSDWIHAINAEKAKLSADDYLRSIADGFYEAQRFGTTAIVNLEAFPELIGRCSPPLRTWWCAELIDVTAPDQSEQIVSDAAGASREIKNSGFGLAPHALFTASPELYRHCQKIASSKNLLLTTHLAESREEMQMFGDATGPLFEFLRALGRDESDCGRTTPLEKFLQIIRGSSTLPRSAQNDGNESIARWIIAHLNELTERDCGLLAELPEKFSITHCPRSHSYFRHSPFPFERLSKLGFNICLGTDSLASNADLSLFREMREFRNLHHDISAGDILKMVTVNPAKALGRSAELGRIAHGFSADMIALPIIGWADIHEQILAFDAEVPWMMIGGELV